jgi:hypothetical protein
VVMDRWSLIERNDPQRERERERERERVRDINTHMC